MRLLQAVAQQVEPLKSCTVDSNKLEYAPGTMLAGFPSSQAFGVEGQSYFNFLVSTVALGPHFEASRSLSANTPNSHKSRSMKVAYENVDSRWPRYM